MLLDETAHGSHGLTSLIPNSSMIRAEHYHNYILGILCYVAW